MMIASRVGFLPVLLPALLLWGLFSGCESAPNPPTSEETEPRTLSDPATDADGVLRVLVYHDMEGLAGQSDTNTFFAFKPEYALGRELLTADVNAVVAGLFEGGADQVHVVDAHGSTSPEPDLLLDQLDPRAEMVFKDRPFDPYMDLTEPGLYDAIAVVGMHAKTGSRGFASHTFTIGMEVILNGMSITETEVIGFSWGRVDTPVIFASGDDRLASDLETMPWIRFVVTKTATSASTADTRPVNIVREELKTEATRALRDRKDAMAMRVNEPITATLGVVPPARLNMLNGVPGIQYENDAVTFVAADYDAAIEGVTSLMNVAQAGWTELMFEVARAAGDSRAGVQEAWLDAVTARWFDYESGRWVQPEGSPPAAGRRYHGSN